MHMVGRSDYHGVDVVARLVQHLPEVLELSSFWPEFKTWGTALPIHIRQGNHVFDPGMRVAQVAVGLASCAYGGKIEPLVRRLVTEGFQRRDAANTERRHRASRKGCAGQERSPGN